MITIHLPQGKMTEEILEGFAKFFSNKITTKTYKF